LIAASANRGQLTHPISKLLAAEAKHEAARAQLQMLRLVEAEVAGKLSTEFVDEAENIVEGHLRPALGDTLETAGKLASKLEGVGTTDELLRTENEAARKAWLEIERLFPRYRAIREACDAVYSSVFQDEVGVSSLDLRDVLIFRNLDQLPKGSDGRVAVPSRQVQVMVWLVSESKGVRPEPWLPLPEEIIAALEEAKDRNRDKQVAAFQGAQARTAAAARREVGEQEQRDKATDSIWAR
jgi:hypothetical protein